MIGLMLLIWFLLHCANRARNFPTQVTLCILALTVVFVA